MDSFEDMNQWERQLCLRATEKNIPINAVLELTPLCNLNCKMCFVSLKPEEMRNKGRMLSSAEWIGIAEQMKKIGTLYVLLTGGEPLLYPGFKQLYLRLKDLGMVITVNTNGTLIDEEWACFFCEHPPRRICVTLYGAYQETYGTLCGNEDSYDQVVHGIELLQNKGIPVKINGSITPQNIDDIKRIIDIAKRLSVPYKIDTYMFPAERERTFEFDQSARLIPEEAAKARVLAMRESMQKEIFKTTVLHMLSMVMNTPRGKMEKKKMKCRAGRSSFVINWQGNMRFCAMLSAPNIPVMEIGLIEAWKQLMESVQRIRTSSNCSVCQLRRICSVCAASALLETGSYDGVPEYMCRYTKETYRQLAGFCMREMQRRDRDEGGKGDKAD